MNPSGSCLLAPKSHSKSLDASYPFFWRQLLAIVQIILSCLRLLSHLDWNFFVYTESSSFSLKPSTFNLILQQIIKAWISPQPVEDEPEVELAVEVDGAVHLARGFQCFDGLVVIAED
jgi:hypothetical protein